MRNDGYPGCLGWVGIIVLCIVFIGAMRWLIADDCERKGGTVVWTGPAWTLNGVCIDADGRVLP